jgi:hypothetical protein
LPATRPIERDPLERPSVFDRATVRVTAPGNPIAQRPLQSNPIGQALAGTRTGGMRLRGGKFTPRATSGMI